MITEALKMQLNNLDVEVVRKEIKNVHLSVYPPNGRVKVSAPKSLSMETIRVFVISKLGWIKKQQKKLRSQEREHPMDYVERESHYFNGGRYLLRVIENDMPAKVVLTPKAIELYIRPGTSSEKREAVLNQWYRKQLRNLAPAIIGRYEKLMRVSVREFGIRKMKTKWGTCNPDAKRIWINLELAKKPPECLEYIIVHEMVHLLERSHNARFIELMNQFLPSWQFCRGELNRFPVCHEEWKY